MEEDHLKLFTNCENENVFYNEGGGGEIRNWQTENFYNPSNPKQNLKINVICFFRLKQWQVLNII